LSATILATHGVFSKSALKMLESYGDFIKAVVVTNSIPQARIIESGRLKHKFHVLDVSGKGFESQKDYELLLAEWNVSVPKFRSVNGCNHHNILATK
jgi:hypothetical protein